MRDAKVDGSSRENPEVSREVSYRSQMRSLTVLSDLSASAFSRRVRMMGCVGESSMVFFELMYPDMELSRRAWAFMMRSMFAVHPYSPVTRQHGDSTMRLDTMTFSTLVSRTSFMSLQRPSVLAFSSSNFFFSSVSLSCRPSLVAQMSFLPSYSLSCWTQYSS